MFRQDLSWLLDNTNSMVKKDGGIALQVGSKWYSYVTLDHEFTCSTPDIELLTVSFKKPGRPYMSIINVYRPPNGDNLELISKLKNVVAQIKVKNPEIWSMGDFNMYTLGRNNRLAVDFDFKQLVSGKTRIYYRGWGALVLTCCIPTVVLFNLLAR